MEKDHWIREAESFLTDRLGRGNYLCSHRDALEYRIEHSRRVSAIGRQIAVKEGFDETEMTVACLLHDIAYSADFGENGWKDHGRQSAAMARPFLRKLGLADDRIDDICYGIAVHVDGNADFEGELTPFAATIGNADKIDRFGAFRIHQTLCLDGFLKKSLDGKKDYIRARLSRLHGLGNVIMATYTAEEMWRERLAFYTAFFQKLSDQLEISGVSYGCSGHEEDLEKELKRGTK
ncbi:MAG: HD domain-containing protein [Clostridia bacterium]|nr:HD domain-containing protein [Clostridia bacterium]